MDPIKEIKDIQAEQKNLMEAMNNAVERAFPVGSTVDFYRGRGWRSVEILRVVKAFHRSHDPRFWVRNIHTGTEYIIDLYWLLNKAP